MLQENYWDIVASINIWWSNDILSNHHNDTSFLYKYVLLKKEFHIQGALDCDILCV